jgi:Crp-like helix-turn-helix protein
MQEFRLFNSSEKRLARILLLLAHFGKEGVPETLIPKISQETLAEMIGTIRSRVSFFMNRFRKLGFIDYHAGDDLQIPQFTSQHCSPRLEGRPGINTCDRCHRRGCPAVARIHFVLEQSS